MVINILFSLLVPLISSVTNIFIIPHVLTTGEFGNWRFILTVLSFSGVLHLGYADGLYKEWIEGGVSRRKIYVIPLTFSIILSAFVVALFYLYFTRDILSSTIILTGMFIISLSSFGSYYALFTNNSVLRYILLSQSTVMLLGVIILNLLNVASVASISILFISSYLPFILILRNVIDYSNDFYPWLLCVRNGLPLLLANLSLVAFMNIDKIILKLISGEKGSYAGYSLGSSIFVISCSVGLTIGNLLISRYKNIVEMRVFRILVCAVTIVVSLISPNLSNFLNILLPKYNFNYTYFFVLSVFSFSFCAFYFSYSRIFLTRTTIAILSYFIPYFIICIYYAKYLSLNIYIVSPAAILFYVILSILITDVQIEKYSKDRRI